jgi:hypothetical protein
MYVYIHDCLLKEIIEPLEWLSLALQKTDTTLPDVHAMAETTLEILEQLQQKYV